MDKLVKNITDLNEDFSQWYTDIVKKAQLLDYSGIKGCNILCPYGFAIWEIITSYLDFEFKKLEVENVSMPLLIPESLLQKEKNHIKGFAPEVAWVTHGGNEELTERLCIRPTSEVLFCNHFSKIINSWRDLPKLYNQWCSIIRWEKSSRPFLRSIEIHWQEGHTVHENPNEACDFAIKILNLYVDFFEKILCIPVIAGIKTELERFAGAKTTYTVECITKNGKCLQVGTSHYFGNDFTKAFDVKFQNKKNESEFAYYTSWGVSTRIIGAVIMVHGDNDGLVLPPKIAPIQIIIIPIKLNNEILMKTQEIFDIIKNKYRVKIDKNTQNSPGWKFSEYEMKGVPLRIEIGPRDIVNKSCVFVTRYDRKKYVDSVDEILSFVDKIFLDIEKNMYENAKSRHLDKIFEVDNILEFEKKVDFEEKNDCIIKTFWCGKNECETDIKTRFGFSSRCIPFKNGNISESDDTSDGKCIVCLKKTKTKIYWGKSY